MPCSGASHGGREVSQGAKETGYGQKRSAEDTGGKVKFEVFGEEMLEKKVSMSGNSGRIISGPIGSPVR